MLYTLNLYITCQVYLIKKNTLGFQSHPFIFLTLFSFSKFCLIKISQCHLHYHHGLSLWRWECVSCRTSLCQAFPSLLHIAHPTGVQRQARNWLGVEWAPGSFPHGWAALTSLTTLAQRTGVGQGQRWPGSKWDVWSSCQARRDAGQ